MTAAAPPDRAAQSLDVVRRTTTLFLAVYLWLHALFFLNVQSAAISRISTLIRLTGTEILIFILIIIFSFLAASGFWKTVRSLAYIYFFPFVLLMYAFYSLYLVLRAINRWFVKQDRKLAGAKSNESEPLLVDSTAQNAATAQPKTDKPESAHLVLSFLLRPFTRFMFLWCVLLVATTHREILWLCLIVVSIHLVRKLFFILKIVFFSDEWFSKIGSALPAGLHAAIAALSAVTNDTAPSNELTNTFNQLKLWKKILNS